MRTRAAPGVAEVALGMHRGQFAIFATPVARRIGIIPPMLILRQLPDPKRLEPLPRNAAYRKAFYARWGVENCIVLARSRRVEFPVFTQRLSIKMATGGRERYLLTGPDREVDVDADNFLILNDGRAYGSVIAAEQEVESYSIFFRAGFAEEVAAAIRAPIGRALEGAT